MPLITFDEFKGLLARDVVHLDIADSDEFAVIEVSASNIVTSKTGLEIPADADDAPQWVKLPVALICLWVATTRNPSLSAEFVDDANVKYKAAIDMLADNKVKSTKGVSRHGEIGRKYSW